MTEVKTSISIEVAYATPLRQKIIALNVPLNVTLQQAIEASGILDVFPEIDLANQNVGVWSRAKKLTDTLRDGDRIEIYRSLIADPKEVRKRRAEKAKAKKK